MILKTTSGLQVVQKVKNPPAKTADTDSITGLGRSPGEEKDSPLQYSCVKNPMDREAWQAQSTGTQTNGTGLGNWTTKDNLPLLKIDSNCFSRKKDNIYK